MSRYSVKTKPDKNEERCTKLEPFYMVLGIMIEAKVKRR